MLCQMSYLISSCPDLSCLLLLEGGKGYFRESWSALFFPVKCEMANFFLVNRDVHTSREAWFSKITFRETRNKCLIRREPGFHYVFVFRELWKNSFTFRETWSRPPFYHPRASCYCFQSMQRKETAHKWSIFFQLHTICILLSFLNNKLHVILLIGSAVHCRSDRCWHSSL